MRLYRFLTGPDDAAFCHKVSAALNQGWELYGAPTMSFHAQTGQMMGGQAVVKTVDGKEYSPDLKLSEQ